MLTVQRFKEHILQQHLFDEKDNLILAVSGGLDSVVLYELCKQAGFRFTIAHCNFQLRGEESERDEEFVRGLGGDEVEVEDKAKVKVKVKRFDTSVYAEENKLSIQEAARKLRYEWFAELVDDANCRLAGIKTVLLTAHHADDSIETSLMNFLRGTGLSGLTGIPAVGEEFLSFVRRPLLPFTREEIKQFAIENNLSFVEDSSNQSIKYTRNYFRHEIIPAISKVFPQVKQNIQNNIERFTEIEQLYNTSVGEIVKKLCKQKGKEVHIPVKQLMGYKNKALIYFIISNYGFAEKQIDELIKLAESESGKYIESPDHSHRVIRHRHWFIIAPVVSMVAEHIVIEKDDKQVVFNEGVLDLSIGNNLKPAVGNYIASLNLKEISFPLLLRKWKAGDYFYPLGMRKKKKLARFFIDQKLSKTDKEKAWVIEMNKKIIWVVGYRIDDRFKLTGAEKEILQIVFSNGQTG